MMAMDMSQSVSFIPTKIFLNEKQSIFSVTVKYAAIPMFYASLYGHVSSDVAQIFFSSVAFSDVII